jgi:hypothetical protein
MPIEMVLHCAKMRMPPEVSTFHCACEGRREIASMLSTLGLLARGGTLYLLAPVI